jgi:DNA adenine methylase
MPRKVTALSPWFGSNRMLAKKAAEMMGQRKWIGVPFAGGMAELREMHAPTMLVSDIHRHVINLAAVVKDHREILEREIRPLLFHPDNLLAAQQRCKAREARPEFYHPGTLGMQEAIQWAADFFVCCWQARSSTAGTKREFDAGLATRWEGGGGDSAKRYQSAIDGLTIWERLFKVCTFVCLDIFDFLPQAHKRDRPEHGIYLDPTFPDTGDGYKYVLTAAQHERMAIELRAFERTRIVLRFYDHPLVRDLYREDHGWTWNRIEGGRDQANNSDTPELLLTRN